MRSSALPFFSSRSSIRDLIYCIATYCSNVYDGVKGEKVGSWELGAGGWELGAGARGAASEDEAIKKGGPGGPPHYKERLTDSAQRRLGLRLERSPLLHQLIEALEGADAKLLIRLADLAVHVGQLIDEHLIFIRTALRGQAIPNRVELRLVAALRLARL